MNNTLCFRFVLASCILLSLGAMLVGATSAALAKDASPWESNFQKPPPAARPWVYWFWLNSNITKEGITADLEAMRRVGVGGVLIMEVDQGAPVGPVGFASPEWLDMFKHACVEAARLGIEINMNNDAGWNGSGGPWIKPEQSMQKIVWTETKVEGPRQFAAALDRPQAVENYYEDIAVMAFPTPAKNARIPNLSDKASYSSRLTAMVAPATWPTASADEIVAPDRILTLSAKMDKAGRLTWDVPEGRWTILRLGHTTTGKKNHPSPASGSGLECDKMSKEAAEAHFAGLMGKIIAAVGPQAGKSLVATHIDSWENGSQNWTPKFREEFQRRRGYDMMPFFPAMAGRIVGSRETTERFLWDIRKTVGELVLENYAGHFREMAHRNGLKLSIEAYTTCPCDELAFGGYADEPIGEFWSWWFRTNKKYGFSFSATEMASVAHIYGKKIVGAEAFTACNTEKWLGHPANMKDLGDWAFCEGINRFIFHRYAMQPWRDVKPGMSMGPWGLHYERTQTWWEMSKAWHEYLARCQYLLREGLFVADVCYLGAEASPQSIKGQKRFLALSPDPLDPDNPDYPRDRVDYSFDICSTDALLTRMSVTDGRLTLPDGMSYRLLVLPHLETMTPKLLSKIKELIEAGATVAGPRPLKSPSLSDYPRCDDQVQQLAAEIWGREKAPAELIERKLGQGRLFYSAGFEKKPPVGPNPQEQFSSARWIWHPESTPALNAPPGKRYFRKSFSVEGDVKSALLAITADNSFTCWINGKPVGNGSDHTRPFDFYVATLLKTGMNCLTVEAVNGANSPNPAGLLALLTIQYGDGRKQTIATDKSWESANAVAGNWNTAAGSGEGWIAARELGSLGMAPWGTFKISLPNNELYPEVDLVTGVLKKMGVRPDFTYRTQSGTKSLRYIHRTEDGKDIYFVANKRPDREEAVCSFRVRGKRPEFWWPDTGRIERPAVYHEADGMINVPISFDPVGSMFVIFREPAAPASARITSVARDGKEILGTTLRADPPSTANNGPRAIEKPGITLSVDSQNQLSAHAEQPGKYTLKLADGTTREVEVDKLPAPLALDGDWDVAFSAKDGGPAHVKFDKLISWSEHPDSGVKYYSGTAAYTKKFTVTADQIAKNRRFLLDLGRVEVMAHVKLNAKDLGILWKPPYAADITSAIQPGENVLEVNVVNLPINRQIGDEFLPEDSDRKPNGTLNSWPQWLLEGKPSPTGRYTFTSWRLWNKNDPLQPSGLIGPARITSGQIVPVK